MEILAELAGNPHKCAPAIHIAGSKGKGSVTSMTASILSAAGYRVARYMSPHVIDIRERISINGLFFDEEIYCNAGDELRHVTDVLLPGNLLFDSETGCEPTFWELLTLLFFLCAQKAKCDIMVVETGMGGRLDSTNILDPLVSIITLIELEHTTILGNTITAIAGEKAGIIKTDKPLVLAKQCDEALEVFRKKAKEKNSALFYLPEIAEISNTIISLHNTEFELSFKPLHFSSSPLCELCASVSQREILRLNLPIPGKVQAENAALAITALKIALQQVNSLSCTAIRSGLANLKIPGRFENITPESTPFIIDGAHTPESLNLCIETFCSLYGEGGILLFGCAADKDAAAMAKIACPHFSKIIITTPGNFKISNPEKVYKAFTLIAGQEKIMFVPDTQEAVRQTIEFAKNLPILGTGSFYLVSEIRKIVTAVINF